METGVICCVRDRCHVVLKRQTSRRKLESLVWGDATDMCSGGAEQCEREGGGLA